MVNSGKDIYTELILRKHAQCLKMRLAQNAVLAVDFRQEHAQNLSRESHANGSVSPKRASDEVSLALFAYAQQAPRSLLQIGRAHV